MKIKQSLEFDLDVEVVRNDEGGAHIVLLSVDSDGGEYFYPKSFEWEVDTDLGDGRCGVTLDTVPADQIPEGWSNEQIIDAYFNSPYGVG